MIPGNRWVRSVLVAGLTLVFVLVHLGAAAVIALSASSLSSPSSRGSGQDALWLGHAWVDGRRTSADVAALTARLDGTGIRDLYVHTGPFNDDGSLDPGLRPRARWLTAALHAALPGVRVQAWLGAHPVPSELHLDDPVTRSRIVASVEAVLGEGFDGVHYDFEPLKEGDPHLLAILRESRPAVAAHGAVLSVSAVHLEPWSGLAARMPGRLSLWSASYLASVAALVDQVAVMSYDTGLPTASAYAGYVRQTTEHAIAAMPAGVELLIGVPAYHDRTLLHHNRAETVAAALRGVRLAQDSTGARVGVALYVDFAATEDDWSAYLRDWAEPSAPPPSR